MRSERGLLILLSVLLLLTGCGRERSGEELSEALLSLYSDAPVCERRSRGADILSPDYLSPEEFAYLYTGKREPIPEWNGVKECEILLSRSTVFFEIHIFIAGSREDADDLEKLLARRKALLSLYAKEEGSFPLDDPLLYRNGVCVVLLGTYDNALGEALLREMLP